MKHTKKRALLSAVAMLIVSAVVLSSATFAWFTAGNQATITGIGASVGTSSSLQVSSDEGTSWKSALIPADFGKADDYFPGQLVAVSTAAAASTSFFNGSFTENSDLFTSSSATDSVADLGGKLVKFTFLIRATSNVTVSYTTSSLTGNAVPAVYTMMKIGAAADNAAAATPVVLKAAGDSYYPVNTAGTAHDTNGNFIIDSADSPLPTIIGSSTVSATPFSSAATFGLTANAAKQVIVFMWLEGNDAQCFVGTGGVVDSASLGLTFTATPA